MARAQAVRRMAMAGLFGTALAAPVQAQPVQGYVDLHSHLTAEMSFGGSWYWGTVEGSMDWAVRRCDGNFNTKSHAATMFPVVSEMLGADTGWHLGRRRGYDRRRCKYFLGIRIPGTCPREHFEDWPKWDAIAHQQMWHGWLQQARQGGLRIMVVSLAESNFLCSHTALVSRRYDCDEMASVRRQAAYAHELAARNASWMGIATSPAAARDLIRQGKLALVLAVEVTKLFPTGDYLAQLDQLRGLGIRSVQVVHHADNRFAGAAPIPKLMKAANRIELLWSILLGLPPGIAGVTDVTDIDEMTCRTASGAGGECNGDTRLNVRGLTADGDALVRAMMDRGMIVDVAHLSRKAFAETYEIARQKGNYPLLYSHAHMWDTVSSGEERHEKYLRADEIHQITDTGGMVGLRTGPEATTSYSSTVANTCSGSSRSFAQSLMYAVDNGLTVGFGADMNGFIEQMKPRYRFLDCRSDFTQIAASGGANDLHKKGLGHVGLLPALMADLQAVGVPAHYRNHLNQSAENFLQMWERGLSLAGGSNLARLATTSGSTTYCSGPGTLHCYDAARVNDGSTDTTVGGFYSWTNANGAPMPQAIELTWPSPILASRVDLYTSAGYEIRDYDVQYWNGITWVTVPLGTITGNTAVYRSHPFPSVSATRIRILGRRGPAVQPGYVRVNEIEVY